MGRLVTRISAVATVTATEMGMEVRGVEGLPRGDRKISR